MARRNTNTVRVEESNKDVETENQVNTESDVGTTEVEEQVEGQVEHVIKDVNPILHDYNLEVLKGEYKTKSALIRFLASKTYKRADIARALGLRYQHVKNVLDAPMKTNRGATTQPNPELARRVEESTES